MLIKSKIFILATLLFIVITLAVIWFVFPPIIADYRSTKEEISKVENDILNQEKFIASIKSLSSKKEQLDTTYEFLQRALPDQTNAEILLLELDGLLNSLDITADLTVPFETPATSKKSSSSTTQDDANDIKPGSQGASQPTVVSGTSANATSNITIAGDFGFQKAKELIVALRAFIRFNKISSLTISASGESIKTTITSQVYSSPAQNLVYTGNGQILDKATEITSKLKSYTTTPDITQEGTYGKSDPFN